MPHTSGEEIALFDEDDEKLAQARQPREGELLPAEFGDFAGDFVIVTPIEDVPGGEGTGEGTYVWQWGGGTQTRVSEEELRRSVEEQREIFKTPKSTEPDPNE